MEDDYLHKKAMEFENDEELSKKEKIEMMQEIKHH